MKYSFPLILDGAFGTSIQRYGFGPGECAETWSLEHPDAVLSISRSYRLAGSQILYAPTFGANDSALGRHGIFNRTEELNMRLVALCREAAGDTALVAGDISSTGEMLYPLGNSSFEDLYNVYHSQAAALEKAGADLFVIETMTSVPEARAAVLAVKDVSDKPIFVSFSCDANGRTMMGTDVCAALVILQSMGIDAFGLNCSAGPKEMVPQFERLRRYAHVPLLAKPNAGLPSVENGKTIYSVGPEEFASYVPALIHAGVSIFGGCCGTDERYIAALKAALEGIETEENISENQDMQFCATERDVFSLPLDAESDEALPCDDELEDAVYDADPGELLSIEITGSASLDVFREIQGSIRNPLRIVCSDAALLEQALRIYQGRALYGGALPQEALFPLSVRYGLII